MKLLYIAGYPRVGSTLVGNILNEVPGLTHVGEVVHTSVILGRRVDLCGCGVPPHECPFWLAVADRAGDLEDLRSLYGAIASETEAEWIVDTSKSPAHLERVRAEVRPERLVVVHLLRDPRGSIHSRMRSRRAKQERRGERPTPIGDLGRYALDARRWVADVTAVRGADLELRYEDLAADPRAALASLLGLIGRDRQEAATIVAADGTVALGTNHGMVGNRNRHTTGSVTVRPDDRWRSEMASHHRALVWSLAGRTAQRHGYRR